MKIHSIITLEDGSSKSNVCTSDGVEAEKVFSSLSVGVVYWYRHQSSITVLLKKIDHEANRAQAESANKAKEMVKAKAEQDAEALKISALDAYAAAKAKLEEFGVDISVAAVTESESEAYVRLDAAMAAEVEEAEQVKIKADMNAVLNRKPRSETAVSGMAAALKLAKK